MYIYVHYHVFIIFIENVYLIGIDEDILSDEQDGIIRKHRINVFSYQTIKRKGIAKIMKTHPPDLGLERK